MIEPQQPAGAGTIGETGTGCGVGLAWPPRFGRQVDQARMHWLTHPALDAAELRLAPDLAALVAASLRANRPS
jgi:hypothetical protein